MSKFDWGIIMYLDQIMTVIISGIMIMIYV